MEIGFGVGINFLATCEEWLNESKSKKPLQYIAFDKALFSQKQFEKAITLYPNLKNLSNEYIKFFVTSEKDKFSKEVKFWLEINKEIRLVNLRSNV